MADPELVRVLDYILNRCDEAAIDAVAAAVVRRKKDLALFGAAGLPDPRVWAKNVAKQASVGAGLDSVRKTVRSMAADMLRREAPELTDDQIDELLAAWVPDAPSSKDEGAALPFEVVQSMADQFIAYSTGSMRSEEDAALRAELGAWPERYWRAFPAVVKSVITDYLEGLTTEGEFRSKLRAALELGRERNA
jgi:hypothetical protein